MKRFTRILALTLALLLIVSAASCGVDDTKKFSRGVINGDSYVSEFLGLTFTKPTTWEFLTDEEISELTGVASSYMKDPEAFEKSAEGNIIDFYAQAGNGDNVNIDFVKGGLFTKLDPSIEASVNAVRDQFSALGLTVTDAAPVEVKLGNLDFKMAALTETGDGISMMQYCYYVLAGKYFVSITCTTVSGMTPSQFEAMFS